MTLHYRGENDGCWSCGTVHDCVSPADDNVIPPVAGDFGICFDCGEVCVYTGVGITSRAPSDAERADALALPLLVMARGSILAFRGGGD